MRWVRRRAWRENVQGEGTYSVVSQNRGFVISWERGGAINYLYLVTLYGVVHMNPLALRSASVWRGPISASSAALLAYTTQ